MKRFQKQNLINNNFFQSQEVEETLKRIQAHKGVVGTIVVNNEGGFVLFRVFAYYLLLVTKRSLLPILAYD